MHHRVNWIQSVVPLFLFAAAMPGVVFGMASSRKPAENRKPDSSAVATIDTTRIDSAAHADEIDLGGMVIDHTISVLGRNFVYLFNQSWNPPPKLGDYTIVIEEKPMPTLGTLIFIKINGNYVFKRFIKPRYDAIRQVAQQAAAVVLSYVENYRQIERQLDGEDMSGTGIY